MAGHGGGAWKVAYADFVTAMMAFFLVMWITSQSKPIKVAVAEYFRDPYGSQKMYSSSPFATRGPDAPASMRLTAKQQMGWGFMPGDTPIARTGVKNHGKRTPPPDDDPQGEKLKPNLRTRILISKMGESPAMGGAVEFGENQAGLSSREQARLTGIATELAGKPHMIEIFGHVSGRPLPPGTTFADRWDLGYARCRNVAGLLESMNIERERFRMVVGDQAGLPGRSFALAHPLDCAVEVYLIDVLPRDSVPAADPSGPALAGKTR